MMASVIHVKLVATSLIERLYGCGFPNRHNELQLFGLARWCRARVVTCPRRRQLASPSGARDRSRAAIISVISESSAGPRITFQHAGVDGIGVFCPRTANATVLTYQLGQRFPVN